MISSYFTKCCITSKIFHIWHIVSSLIKFNSWLTRTAADVTEDLENKRSASLNFLFLLSPLLLVFLAMTSSLHYGNSYVYLCIQNVNLIKLPERFVEHVRHQKHLFISARDFSDNVNNDLTERCVVKTAGVQCDYIITMRRWPFCQPDGRHGCVSGSCPQSPGSVRRVRKHRRSGTAT